MFGFIMAVTLPYAFAQGGAGWTFSYKEQGADWGFIPAPAGVVNNCTVGKK
tara:strand:+ start:62 stop:214 length:153 start_codon:yes stop_codon:yes gene_type:complete